MTINERHELEDKYRHLGYVEGRNYILDSLSEAIKDQSGEIVEFVWKFTKLHSDSNVEIK